MSSYTVTPNHFAALQAELRPLMVADPKFMAECQQSMTFTPTAVTIYFDRSAAADPRLHAAAIKYGTLNQ